ncbi:MAG: hypothetical protein IJB31_01090 [Akkermansia sp.]|nr:hypothetical protein [Akkermansia sp.]
MRYYLLQTLLVAPLAVMLMMMEYCLHLSIPYVGDAALILPSILCCATHLWGRKARILSWGALYVCVFLPLLAATLYCMWAHGQAPAESMIGMLYIVAWWLNFLTCSLLLTLTAMSRVVCGSKI